MKAKSLSAANCLIHSNHPIHFLNNNNKQPFFPFHKKSHNYLLEVTKILDNFVDILIYCLKDELHSNVNPKLKTYDLWKRRLKGYSLKKNPYPYQPSICYTAVSVCMTVFMWVCQQACVFHPHTFPHTCADLNSKAESQALKVLKLMVWILSSPVRCVKSL